MIWKFNVVLSVTMQLLQKRTIDIAMYVLLMRLTISKEMIISYYKIPIVND